MSITGLARALHLYHHLLLLLLLLLLVVVVAVCGASDSDSCTPFTYTCGPIAPSPPSSYIARIEAVDVAFNRTHYLEEHYDYYSRRLAITELAQETFTHTIFFYAYNTVAIMTTYLGIEDGETPVDCVVAAVSDTAPWMSAPDGTLLAMAPAQALLFGDNYKYSWVNNASEREVPCNRWDACIGTSGNDSLLVEYHWSDPTRTLDMFGYSSERPVTARVTGQMFPGQGSMMPVYLDMIYNFAVFDDSPTHEDLRWAFEIPSNVYCPGLPNVKKAPTRLADAFSLRVEFTVLTSALDNTEVISTSENWYDYYRKLSRADTVFLSYRPEGAIAGEVKLSVVQDFNSGVEYIIDKTLGNCTAIPIPLSWDDIPAPDGSYSIKNPLILFGLGQVSNVTYYGTKYARGLPCDVWVGHLDYVFLNGTFEDNLMYEIYFLKSDWRADTGAGPGPQERLYQEPVLIKLQQDYTIGLLPQDLEIVIEENIFKFEEKEPGMDVFDITPCFTGHEHIRRFQIAFPGRFRVNYQKRPTYFTYEILESLAITLSIPTIRVQHMLIEFNENDGRLYTEFTLLDRPHVEGVDLPDTVGPPLFQVVKELEHVISTYFAVVIYDSDFTTPGHVQLMVAYKDSLREMYESDCNPLRDHQDLHHHSTQERHTSPEEAVVRQGGEKPAVDGQERGEVETAVDEGSVDQGFLASLFSLVRGMNQDRNVDMKVSYDSDGHMTRSGSPSYSPGDMAGMGVGMFLTGVLLGSILMLVGLRHLGLTSSPEMIPLSSSRRQ